MICAENGGHIVIPENETMSERAREIECNASIIYLEKTQAADAIHNYINTWHSTCNQIIIVDTDEATLRAWTLGLTELQERPVTAILVHH